MSGATCSPAAKSDDLIASHFLPHSSEKYSTLDSIGRRQMFNMQEVKKVHSRTLSEKEW